MRLLKSTLFKTTALLIRKNKLNMKENKLCQSNNVEIVNYFSFGYKIQK